MGAADSGDCAAAGLALPAGQLSGECAADYGADAAAPAYLSQRPSDDVVACWGGLNGTRTNANERGWG